MFEKIRITTKKKLTLNTVDVPRSLSFVHNAEVGRSSAEARGTADIGTQGNVNGAGEGCAMTDSLNNDILLNQSVDCDIRDGTWQFSTQQEPSHGASDDDEDDGVENDNINSTGKRKRGGRKIHFSEVEALGIAQAWVSQSEQSASQRGAQFWDGVAGRLEKDLGVKRSVESIRSLWKRMNRDCQLYISIKTQVEERGATSGKNEQQIEQMVSDLFTSRSGKLNSEGIRVPGPPFRFKKVAEYLVEQPKWRRRPSRIIKQSPDGTNKTGDSTKVGSTVLFSTSQGRDDGDKDGECRPKGVKARKLEDKHVVEKKKMRREMKELNRLIEKSNRIAESTAQRDRRVFLLGIMPDDTPNYGKYMEEVIAEEFSKGYGSRCSGKTVTDGEKESSLNYLSSDSE